MGVFLFFVGFMCFGGEIHRAVRMLDQLARDAATALVQDSAGCLCPLHLLVALQNAGKNVSMGQDALPAPPTGSGLCFSGTL